MNFSFRLNSIVSVVGLCALCMLYSHAVQAQEPGTGLFIPDQPLANKTIIYRFNFALGCPPIPFPNVDGESDWLLVDENDIHLFVVFDQMAPCGVPPSGPVVDFGLGTLAVGDYTLFFYRVPTTVTFPANPAEFNPVFETPFGVVEGATSIPSLNALGLVLLVILLLGVAGWRLFSLRSLG